jgi:3-oxoacyl-[acyl-carrier protein] reductase
VATSTACRWRSKADVADVSIPQDVRRVVDGTKHEFGRIDILINNAGVGATSQPTDDLDKSLADYERLIGTNLRGEFMFGRAVLPYMIARKGGASSISTLLDSSI